jgi:hypothetical protein
MPCGNPDYTFINRLQVTVFYGDHVLPDYVKSDVTLINPARVAHGLKCTFCLSLALAKASGVEYSPSGAMLFSINLP